MICRFAAEAAGTYILTLGVAMLVYTGNGTPYWPALSLFTAMSFTGFISGGQFNPAVSAAALGKNFLQRSLTIEVIIELGGYIVLQFVFGFLGAFTSYAIVGQTNKIEIMGNFSTAQGVFAEVAFSTALVGCAMMAGEYKESPLLGGGAVASALLAGAYAVGGISGAVFNPAVGLGVNLMHIMENSGSSIKDTWVYFVGPLGGAAIAVCLNFIFLLQVKEDDYKQQPQEEE